MLTGIDEFAQRLRNQLTQAIAESDRQLAEGYADTFDNYKDRVGYRRGLVQTLEIILPEVIREMGS